MQAFATATLRCASPEVAGKLELQRLLLENDAAGGPRVQYPRTSGDPYRPAGVPARSEYKFSLDYDFRKHEVPPLGRTFGVPAWQIAEQLEKQASGWDPGSPGMYEGYGRYSRGTRSSADGRFRSYGAHLGWHALFVVAGRLRATRSPAAIDEWGRDPWHEFIERHGLSRDDGFWLSDGTDPYPAAAHDSLRARGDDGEDLVADVSTLLGLAGVHEGRALSAVVAQGTWDSRDDVKIYVRTAMVRHDKAIAACKALAGRPNHDVWLPQHEGDDDSHEHESNRRSPFEPWIVSVEARVGWDEFDPFSATSAVTRPIPGAAFRLSAGITPADPFKRSWVDQQGHEAMRAFAWGQRRGYGEYERKLAAEALLCESGTLRQHLASTGRSLAILVKIERYSDKHSQSTVRFRSTAAVGVVAADGVLVFSASAGRVARTGDW